MTASLPNAERAVALFSEGCLATRANQDQAQRFLRSAGLTEVSQPIVNTTILHNPEGTNVAALSSFSGPGVEGTSCSVSVDNVAREVGMAAVYAVIGQHRGETETGQAPNVTFVGGLPEFEDDGSFEALQGSSGMNEKTGNPFVSLVYTVGRSAFVPARPTDR